MPNTLDEESSSASPTIFGGPSWIHLESYAGVGGFLVIVPKGIRIGWQWFKPDSITVGVVVALYHFADCRALVVKLQVSRLFACESAAVDNLVYWVTIVATGHPG